MQQQSTNQISFLTSKNFLLGQGNNGKLLFNNIPGISIVLMYSTNCSICHKVIPIFQELPNFVSGCKFAVINIDNNKEIIAKSELTTMPIKYVPQIIFFHNGKPFLKYTGEKNKETMIAFFNDTISRVQKSVNFSKQSEKKKEVSDDYELGGVPYNVVCDADSDMCYLTDGELSVGKEDDCSDGSCCYLADNEL